jgi:hypothetical protein
MTSTNIVELPIYGKGKATFEVITDINLVDLYCSSNTHIWFLSIQGDARKAKVNGKVKRWKRDKDRIEIPVKYGMYECGKLDSSDITNGRILKPYGE